MMSEPQRLHPVAVIIRLVKLIREMIATFIIIIVGFNDEYQIYAYIAFGAIILIIIISSILYWLKYNYQIEDNEFRLEYGVFIKKKRYVPIERIQTIHISEGVIQRIFRLVKLQIETAGGDLEAEIELSAIRKSEAERIQQFLREQKNQLLENEEAITEAEIDEEQQKKDTIYKIKPIELLITAATSSGIGVILSIMAFLSQFEELLPFQRLFGEIQSQFEVLLKAGIITIVIIAIFALFIAWILSIIGVALKYANFSVELQQGELRITKGLLERQQVTISLEKIQAIRIVENPIRQMLGYATVHIDTAGSFKEGEVASILFPLIKKSLIKEKVESVLNFTVQEELHSLPKRALYRKWVKNLFLSLIIVVPVILLLKPWGYFSIVLIPIFFLLGYAQYRDAGWKIDGKLLTLAYRTISKTTVLMEKKRIQAISVHASYFQRRKKLVTLLSTVKSGFAGGTSTVVDVDEKDAQIVYEWFSKKSTQQTIKGTVR